MAAKLDSALCSERLFPLTFPLDSLRQMAILDGNAYDAKCLEAGQERDEDLESCSLLLNNKGTALLQPGASASHSAQHKVVVQLQVRVRLFLRGWPLATDWHATTM